MKPIYQTKFMPPKGNCLQACLASIFELPLEEVPEFDFEEGWYEQFVEWCLTEFGLQPIDISADSKYFKPMGWHMINGKSPRGDWNHAVVAYGGEILHDPFPEGGGKLEDVQSYTVFIKVLE